MGKDRRRAGLRYVQTLFNVGAAGGLTDGQLLERFTAHSGEAAELAFATLVERHGPMVFGVCRAILREPHAAEDAFQATFLVLARRAGSLWVRDSLGPWLHQVAYRVASCARSAERRRRRHERRAAELSGPGAHEEDRDDLGDVLHDEVDRLPSSYRAAVVLCYFEGLSPEQAARQLGCPVGTVQSRLARGRKRLHSRLTRRGVAPAIGAPGVGTAAEANPASPAAALIEATIHAVLPRSASGGASGSVIRLTGEVLRSMFLMKLRTVVATIITMAALAAGAQAVRQNAKTPRPQANLDQVRSELGAGQARQGQAAPEVGPPPQNLTWTDIAPAETLRVIDQLAAQSKGNYEKIKTWQGTYAYVQRQHLDAKFVAQFLVGAQAPAGQAAPKAKIEDLTQEFDSVLTFAIDVGTDSIYRDVVTKRMRFLKPGTDEEVKVPNVGADDHRSIVTPDVYLRFNPKERATSAFLPDLPDAQRKRRVERFAATDARHREGGTPDPRAFFKFDPVNSFWTGLELYAQAFRGELGAEHKKTVEQRLKIGQAHGPGGRWYRDQMGFSNPGGSTLWITTLWSPQAGYNPVSRVAAFDKPDGKPQSKTEWQWKVIDGVYVPAAIKEAFYSAPGGGLSREQQSRLTECSLNRPLGPHQFDEWGLGLDDGDLILDHPARVAYMIKGGKSVRLANFGEGSVLHRALLKPAPARSASDGAKPGKKAVGRIYTRASVATNDSGRPIFSVVAVDPNSGHVTKVMDEAPGRFRLSPDGRYLAFVSGELLPNVPPPERMRQSLWIHAIAGGAGARRVIRLDSAPGGDLPVWSPDSKQIILSVATRDEARQKWIFETFRIGADGSGREPLKIPAEDGVQDWSPDGKWVVTTSTRNAKIGWQLYLMRPDGKDERQLTAGGNPFYARFSPDSKRLLYSDGPQQQRRGIWLVDLDGKNRRHILPTGRGTASACWSPDGQQLAVAVRGSKPEEHGRLEIVNLDGTHHTILTLPSQDIADMPDWR